MRRTWSNATTLGTVSGGTDTGLVSGTCYRYTLTGTDNVGNAVSLVTIVKVDTSAPATPTLAFSNLSNAFYSSGLSRLYFRPVAGGTIKVTASSTDSETGIKAGNAGYTFLTMNSSGGANFTETQTGNVMDYTFGATATAPSTNRTVSSTNNASVASANASYAVTSDSTAPASGALTVNGTAASGGGTSSFSTTGSFTIGTRADYTEAQSVTASGLGSSTLTVASASYSSPNTCGSFGAPTTIVGSPAQGPLTTGCYLYTLTGTDNVGNTVSITTTVKVDTSDPALTLTLGSASGGAYYPGSGTRVYFRPATAGQFNLTPNPSDADTGILSTTVPTAPTMGANWSRVGTGPYTYSYVATGATPGTQTVTTQNNATRSTNTTFDVTADTNAPTGGALSVNGTAASGAGTSSYSTSGSFAIGTRTDYTETQSATESGLASSTLTRASASYSSPNTCGSFGAPTTIGGSPAQGPLATGCYLYTLTGIDNVGNTVSISTTVRVDTSDPSTPALSFANVTGGAFYPGSGTRVYFKPDAVAGSFDVTANSTDADTGIGSFGFPNGATVGTNWSASGSGATRTYSYVATATTSGTQTISATNNAGRSSNSTMDVTLDSNAPAGGALTVNGVAASGGGTQSYDADGSFPIDARTDYSETQNATASGLAFSTLSRATASFSSADTCGSFGAPTTLVGTPAQSGLATGCYRYTLTGTDNVGNTVAITTIVKVDTSAPSAPSLTLSNATGGAYYPGSGTRVYFKPDAAAGGFDVAASATDNDSGVTGYTFPTAAAIGTNWAVSGSGSSRTYTYTPTATTNGSQNVSATNRSALSSTSSFDVALDSTAPAGGALTVNTTAATGGGSQSYDADGSFTIGTRTDYTETQSATAAGLASSTLVRTTASYTSADTCGTFGSPTTLVGTPAQSGLATGCYRYTLTGTDNVGNTVSISTIVKVDTSAPSAPSLTLSNSTGGAYYPGSGTRVFFRPAAASGGFDIAASSTDADSGVASYTFPAGATIGTNWTVSGSGASRTYGYTPTATTSGTQNVTATNNSGLASAASTFDVTADSTAPTGGALTVNAVGASGAGTQSYDGDGNFTIGTRTDYTETASAAASGLASSTLTRANASYSAADTCGSFGAPTTLVGTPAQSGLATGCYRYTLTGTDNVGNTVSISTIVKVDTSAPSAPSLSFSNATGGAYYPGSGTRVFFRPAAASGGFDIAASATDADSGIASYQFPTAGSVGTNWSVAGSGSSRTYSFTPTATTTGTQNVTATNNSGLASAASTFDVTADSTAPTGGALTVNGVAGNGGGSQSYDGDGSFPIDLRTDYSEAASATAAGLASSTLTRANASFSSADTCGSFGAPTTLVGTPAQSGLATGCYRYTLTGTDNVGNTVAITTIVKVDTSAPSAPSLTLSNATGGAYYPGAGTRVYFKPDAAAGGFDIAASSTDGDSGVASYQFPAGGAIGTNWSASGSGATRTYSYTATATTNGTQNVTATNSAGLTSAGSSFDVTVDSTAPTGGALTVNGVAASGGGSQSYDNDGAFTIGARTDYAEAQSATASGLAFSTLSRASASFTSADTCGSFGAPTTLVGTPAQSGLATGCYRYTLTGTDNVGNTISISTTVKVDTSAPAAPSLTLSNATGGAYYPGAGTRVYFKPDAAAGGFDIAASATDGDSGVATYQFPAGGTIGSNWTLSGSGSSRTYSYTATATTTGTQNVTATNNSGLASAASTFDVTADSTAPTGGALTVNATAATGGGSQSYDNDGTFTIGARTDYAEPASATASGLASSTLVRTSASFTSADTCGSFGSPTTLVGTPAQSGLATGCYRYTLTGTDNVGNTISISTTVKVDTSAPSAPSLTLSNATGGAYYPGSGGRVFFRPGAAAGSFDIGALATDGDSGVASYTFPLAATVGTNWSVSGSGPSRTYSYTPTATTSGTQNVTATNNSGLVSGASTFDVTADSTAPTGGAMTVNGVAASGGGSQSYDGDGSFPIDLRTDYGETASATASGLATSTLTRANASFTSADTCGSFGAPTTLVGTPAQSGLATGCYRYTLTGTDNVGNTVSDLDDRQGRHLRAERAQPDALQRNRRRLLPELRNAGLLQARRGGRRVRHRCFVDGRRLRRRGLPVPRRRRDRKQLVGVRERLEPNVQLHRDRHHERHTERDGDEQRGRRLHRCELRRDARLNRADGRRPDRQRDGCDRRRQPELRQRRRVHDRPAHRLRGDAGRDRLRTRHLDAHARGRLVHELRHLRDVRRDHPARRHARPERPRHRLLPLHAHRHRQRRQHGLDLHDRQGRHQRPVRAEPHALERDRRRVLPRLGGPRLLQAGRGDRRLRHRRLGRGRRLRRCGLPVPARDGCRHELVRRG